MSDYVYLTQEGLDKIREELHELKSKGRSEAANAIAEAREKGDLSENAEYDAAKDAQGHLERKIAELENTMALARVLDESQVDTSKVSLLSKVELKNHNSSKTMVYTMVSEKEANIKESKLSVESPIGQGLIGRKKGELVEITTPSGSVVKFEILSISV